MSKSKKDEQTSRPGHKRKIFTRRRVLIGSGAVLASGALAAGGYIGHGWRQRFSRDAEKQIVDHRVALPAVVPKMVIARGPDPALNVRAALERMGGMSRFINSNDVVVIKPNIGWDSTPSQAANTQPAVVAQVVRACREVKPRRIIVCDCPVSASRRSFELSGIMKAALEAGAEVIPPEDSRFHTVKISERLGTWDILEPFIQATKLINVPVAKHHSLTGVVAGMKNWIGVTTKMRMLFHNDIQRSIAELAALMRPTLTVMDATRVIMAKGPRGGNLDDVKAIKTVAVGLDPVALDTWANSLFDIAGDQLPESLSIAQSMGVGQMDFNALGPIEIVTG